MVAWVPEASSQFLAALTSPVKDLTLEERCQLEIDMFLFQVDMENKLAQAHTRAVAKCREDLMSRPRIG
jgi:hypothetical protein